MSEPKTTTERVAALRKRKAAKTLTISGEAAKALGDYQARHGLKNRSEAIKHATSRSAS